MPIKKDTILHYGVKRRSGRYPWGSGEDPNQHDSKFLKEYESLRAQGLNETEIANRMGMNTTQLRTNITWATKAEREYLRDQVRVMKEAGMSNTAIGNKLGISEGTVRNYQSSKEKVEKIKIDNVKQAIVEGVDKTGYLDVGVGVERQIGVSRTMFNASVNKLVADEGYVVHEIYVKNLNNPETNGKANYTTVKVLTKEKDLEVVKANSDKIKTLQSQSDDGGLTLTKIGPPLHIDLDRVKVRYAEEGGEEKDGLIEMRRGAKDLDLGNAHYAQVRIAAGDNLYLKGMAAYSDDKFPDGVDIIFNTNKPLGTPKDKVLKKMKDDPDNPFGANITRQKGALNIVNQEGDWDTWSTKMSSQFLSKQPVSLVKDRIDATTKALKSEFDEISKLTNPMVKKQLMEDYVNSLDSKAKSLKAQGLPRTKSHVLLPVPDLKANEIYAPNYKDGEIVVLVRHPHGGIFEIPELRVNNKNAKARSLMGLAPDAVGIHPTVAQKLSGADFDGDTALVIPNNKGQIKTGRSLKELEHFSPNIYKVGKDSPVNIHKLDPKTGKMVNTGKTITPQAKQTQMGMVSNLITDMTIKGASDAEKARAVKHSMVVIDSEKHNLDYKQSARDNGIAALRKKYQSHINPDTGKKSQGASTLISRSKRRVDINAPGFNPDRLTSGTAVENVYSGYIKSLMKLKSDGTKQLETIPTPKYNKAAAKIYAPEVQSINKKLNVALLNAPKERQAQIMTNNMYYANVKPDMSKDQKKKLRSRALAKARVAAGANGADSKIVLSDKEWEAIQARAISPSKLSEVLRNADMDVVRKLATPKPLRMTTAKASRAKLLLSNGYTYAEIAEVLGVSTSTIREAIK